MQSPSATHEFSLDPQLQADAIVVADLSLCKLLLMNNSALPWLILVPRCTGTVELTDLSREQQTTLLDEINLAYQLLEMFNPDKINTAAIGNVVSQLHIHVLARYRSDPIWPKPVWGVLPPQPYTVKDLEERLSLIRNAIEQLPEQERTKGLAGVKNR